MKIIKDKISIQELQSLAEKMFGNFVKAVVDVEKEVMAIDAEFHSDEEVLLLEKGSRQKNLWGINLQLGKYEEADKFIEFDSMINLRPSQGNRSRGVEDSGVRKKIKKIISKLVIKK